MEILQTPTIGQIPAVDEARLRQQKARQLCGLPLDIEITEVAPERRDVLLGIMRSLRDIETGSALSQNQEVV